MISEAILYREQISQDDAVETIAETVDDQSSHLQPEENAEIGSSQND